MRHRTFVIEFHLQRFLKCLFELQVCSFQPGDKLIVKGSFHWGLLRRAPYEIFLKKYLFALKEAYGVYISKNKYFQFFFFEKGVLFVLAS